MKTLNMLLLLCLTFYLTACNQQPSPTDAVNACLASTQCQQQVLRAQGIPVLTPMGAIPTTQVLPYSTTYPGSTTYPAIVPYANVQNPYAVSTVANALVRSQSTQVEQQLNASQPSASAAQAPQSVSRGSASINSADLVNSNIDSTSGAPTSQ